MRDDAAGELEGRVGGVVSRRLVLLVAFAPGIGNVRRAEAAHGLHLAKEVVEQVAPMAEHVEDDAAAVFLAVVPRGSLRRHAIAFEPPVTELATHSEDAAEEAFVAQLLELQ